MWNRPLTGEPMHPHLLVFEVAFAVSLPPCFLLDILSLCLVEAWASKGYASIVDF